MAQVRPSSMPNFTGTHPYRDAESIVYEACGSLPDDWYALYSVHWLDPERPNVEGECDFVFVGPDIGVVAVEVKGGGVGRDHAGWYSVDRNAVRHPIKNPAKQAQVSRFAILDYLTRLGFDSHAITSTHIICLPQIAKNSLPSLPEAPAPLIIDSEDLLHLDAAVHRAVEYFNPRRLPIRMSSADCVRIADALCPHFESPSRWSRQLWTLRYAIERLTDEQQHLLEATASNKRIALSGPAGSGKTVAVLKFLQGLITSGEAVLSVTPTRTLKAYYQSVLGSERHDALTFDEVPNPLTGRWTCVVCEEAQDCPEEVLPLILRYCENPASRLIIVYDSNQKLVRKYPLVPQYCTQVAFCKVLRNTTPIAQLSTRFYLNAGITPQIAGPDGMPVVSIAVTSCEEVPLKVAEFVNKLVEQDGFSFRDIVVLFGKSGGKWIRKGGATYAGITFRNAGKVWSEHCDDARCVACSGILAFRGMESPAVIMCEIDDLLDHELIEGCYVGMSRAQLVLAMIGSNDTLTRVRAADLNPVAQQRQRVETRLVSRIRATQKVATLLSEGSLSLGTVKNIAPYGVFVRIEGTNRDGLIHRSRISRDRHIDLEALFKVGDQLTVRIDTIDEQTGHVNLSPAADLGPLHLISPKRNARRLR